MRQQTTSEKFMYAYKELQWSTEHDMFYATALYARLCSEYDHELLVNVRHHTSKKIDVGFRIRSTIVICPPNNTICVGNWSSGECYLELED